RERLELAALSRFTHDHVTLRRVRTGDRAATTYQRKAGVYSSKGSRHMPFRHLLLPLALALIVARPLPARADPPSARDFTTISGCLHKRDRGTQEADEAACLMLVAKPCMGRDEASA